ncbi:MAG: alkaline phosphatase [Pirellulaceae bacterium]
MLFLLWCFLPSIASADPIRELQAGATNLGVANWGHWGPRPDLYQNWDYHSNRLIPTYTFGMKLTAYRGTNSVYRKRSKLMQLYGRLPPGTWNPSADYFDQTQLHALQEAAVAQGKKHIFLVIFDGMDWHTTRAAAAYRSNGDSYSAGRGAGLSFQDYKGVAGDFGYMVTSPHSIGSVPNADLQTITKAGGVTGGGYHPELGGNNPWDRPRWPDYLSGTRKEWPDPVTDSAAAATAMNSGQKTYNAAINITPSGRAVIPIARRLQSQLGFSVGAVTNVPISHATPACSYANNVSRNDFQDISRDLLGFPSISHPGKPLPGLDVLIGAGWGVFQASDAGQGSNFVPGNRYLTRRDQQQLSTRYEIAIRSRGLPGRKTLLAAATNAATKGRSLFGFYGTPTAHLPFRTADGQFNPVKSIRDVEEYDSEDLSENPTLADMTEAAIRVLEQNKNGFWLMVEAGDVDWASHDNNIDNCIGAILSGTAAFDVITRWVERKGAWKDTLVIVAADHGHLFFLRDPARFSSCTTAIVDPDTTSPDSSAH